MTPPEKERGAALLSVLLLVAVMATIAATALDRLMIGTRLTANAIEAGQGRAWLQSAEQLTATRIEDLLAADKEKTLGTGWLGFERTMALPDGAQIAARVEDGGNCFNLNSLVQQLGDGRFASRPQGVAQFKALMSLLGIGEGDAARIAAAASDYVDSDSFPLALGAEDGRGKLPPNQLMADASELRAVAGVSDRHFSLLRPWVCALPTADLSSININTLRPEQAPLLAMLSPGKLPLSRARAALAGRPAGGFASASAFWAQPSLADAQPELGGDQLQVRTGFFLLRAQLRSPSLTVGEEVLFDARRAPVHVVQRNWSNAS